MNWIFESYGRVYGVACGFGRERTRTGRRDRFPSTPLGEGDGAPEGKGKVSDT
jgi:hypothetical protein